MGNAQFDRTHTDVGADWLDKELKDCGGGAFDKPDYVKCRVATKMFLDEVLTLPLEEQRRHLDKAQMVNDASVSKDPWLMPQLNIIFGRSTGKLSDVVVIVPEQHRSRQIDVFDP
jgi:hypothetical protein